MKFDYNLKNYDFRLLIYIILENIIGICIIRSALDAPDFRDPQVARQILGSLAGLAICVIVSFIDYRKLLQQANFIYIICV